MDPVQLPAARTGAPQPREDAAVITIDAAGARFFNKHPVSESELETALTQLRAGNPAARVFINGDRKAEFGIAIAVLDQARKLGITKVAIETQPQPLQP